jgi:hypothetical protein
LLNFLRDGSLSYTIGAPTTLANDNLIVKNTQQTIINKTLENTRLGNIAGTHQAVLDLESLTQSYNLIIPDRATNGTMAFVEDLPPITITSPTKDDILYWNTGSSSFINQTPNKLRDATDTHTLISPVQSSADVIVGELTAQTLTNKTIDKKDNIILNTNDTVFVDRVKKQKIVVANIANGTFIDGSTVSTGDIVLIIGQDDSNPAFPSTENGVWQVNISAPPTRLDTGLMSSSQIYICQGGQEFKDTILRCNKETGSDIAGTDSLFFTRIDKPERLYGGLWQNGGSYSITLNAIANTYDKILPFTAGGPNQSSVSVNTATDTITITPDNTRIVELEYNMSWNSTTGGNKVYKLGVFSSTDGGAFTECVPSVSYRQLPNNDVGVTTGSCRLICNGGSTYVFDLRVSCDVASANFTSVSGHLHISEVS